jgi:hypothetical protein
MVAERVALGPLRVDGVYMECLATEFQSPLLRRLLDS